LTPYDFGVAAAAGFFIQIAQRLTNLGFNTALVRLPDVTEDHSRTVFAINVGVGVVIGLTLALTAPWLAGFFRSPDAGYVIPVGGLTFAIGALGVVPSALMARQLKFRQLVIIESLYGWTVSLSSLCFAWWGFGYWSLVYSLLLGATVDGALKLLSARWWPSLRFSKRAFLELWSFGAGLHVKRLLEALAANIDNMVVGRALGVTMLGFYDKSFTTMNRATTLVSSAGQIVSLSVLGHLQGDSHRFRMAFRKMTLGVAVVGYPIMAMLAVLGTPLILVMFGPQWTAAVAPFQVLCTAGTLKIYLTYVSSAVQAKGRVWGEVWRQGVYVASIVIGVAVGSRWGLTGASFGVLLATMLMTGLMFDLLRRVSGCTWQDLIAPQMAGIACSIGLVVAVLATRAVLAAVVGSDIRIWVELLIEAGVGGLFCAVFLLFGPFRDAKELVRETVLEFAPAVGRTLRLGAL